MKKYLFLIMAVLVLFAQGLLPLYAADAENDPRELLGRLYSPAGQPPIRDLLADLRQRGTDDKGVDVQISESKIYFLAPNKFRSDTTYSSANQPILAGAIYYTIIRDGNYVYKFMPHSNDPVGKITVDTPESSLILPFYIQKYLVYNDYKYVYLGWEKIDGQILKVVGMINTNKIADEDYKISMVKVWIDTDKQIPFKVEISMYPDKKDKTIVSVKRITYRDPQKLDDGRYWPFQILIENDAKGNNKFKPECTIFYDTIGINVSLDPSLFTPLSDYVK